MRVHFILLVAAAALFSCLSLTSPASADKCGDLHPCPNGMCCSRWGYCGTTDAYCCEGCQSQCSCGGPRPSPPPPTPPAPKGEGVEEIISEELFEEILMHRSSGRCQGAFYTYDAFVKAAGKVPDFGTTGDAETRKREVAAFLAQTSHETTGGWDYAPDGRFAWGFCWVHEGGDISPRYLDDYCIRDPEFPCARHKKYYGRGPFMLTGNYNYGVVGDALGHDLLSDPDLVEKDPYISFETAFWFWMTPQHPKPSCHDVMTGSFEPSWADIRANRLPGFGLTTNVINGGVECGYHGSRGQKDRIGFYRRFCDMLGVDVGDEVSCSHMKPYWDLGSNLGRGNDQTKTAAAGHSVQ